MSEHTPGPWHVAHPSNNADLGCAIDNSRDLRVACYVAARDAALISVAPELLAALKAVEWGQYDGDEEDTYRCPACGVIEAAEHSEDCIVGNAIAKAEGRQ